MPFRFPCCGLIAVPFVLPLLAPNGGTGSRRSLLDLLSPDTQGSVQLFPSSRFCVCESVAACFVEFRTESALRNSPIFDCNKPRTKGVAPMRSVWLK